MDSSQKLDQIISMLRKIEQELDDIKRRVKRIEDKTGAR